MPTICEFRRAGSRLYGLVAALVLLWGAMAPAAGQTSSDAPELNVDDVTGNFVTLTWETPADMTPEAYVVEGGFAPDDVAGSVSLGPDATSVTLPLPSGVYFIRSYAIVEGQRSQPSNEVQVSVAMPTRPATPDGLAAAAVGNAVVVTWHSNFNAGTPTGVRLEATGPVSGAFSLGDTGEFRIAGVPDGVYELRLRAVNAAGDSDSTPPISVRLPGPVPAVTRAPLTSPDAAALPVRYERSEAPRLAQLRSREQLDAVVAGAPREFDAILRLRDWVAAQFPHTLPEPYPLWDAMIILDEIRAGRTGGFCAQYSQVLLQSLASLGVPARYVEVGTRHNPINHFPIEVWSNDYGKWVVIDADFILHYERDGVPLSAVEVHDAYVTGQVASITVVEGTRAPGHPSPAEMTERTVELYYYVRYAQKADHVFAPYEAAFDRLNEAIEVTDEHTVPWELSPIISPYVSKDPLTTQRTASRAFIEAPINQLWVAPRVSGPAEVSVDLNTNMPNVAAAEYRVIDVAGAAGAWQRHVSPTFVWRVRPGERALEMRAVNRLGVAGPSAVVSLITP